MKGFRRVLTGLLALALLLVSGCSSEAEPVSGSGVLPAESEPEKSTPPKVLTSVKIPYDPEDSLNPFTCTTLQNYYAAGLLYDSLVTLNEVGAAENRLAQEVTFDGSLCIVKLRTDGRFSDGSPVTSQDVLYSAGVAREAPRFSSNLSGVEQIYAPDNYTVVFVLLAPDHFFDRSLTFPIVREGTAEDPLPMGSGRFVLGESPDLLVRNDRYYKPGGNLRLVRLVDAGALLDQGMAVQEGTIDLMYTDLRGAADLSLGLSRRQVVLSNLLYLGVNTQRLRLTAEFRLAFSSLIDREAIIRRAYRGYAAEADSLIKQSFSTTVAAEESPLPETQEELFAALGLEERDEEGWRLYQKRRYTLRLLVNSDSPDRLSAAAILQESFQAAGIQVTLEQAPFEEYALRIAEGNYDLYLGEVRVPGNLDLVSLISPDPVLGPGCIRDEELLEVYRQVKAGEEELSDLDAALRRTMPVIPLAYRRGIIAFSPDFSANIVATEADIFYNIEEW